MVSTVSMNAIVVSTVFMNAIYVVRNVFMNAICGEYCLDECYMW